MAERKRLAAELRRWVVPSRHVDAETGRRLLDQAAVAMMDRLPALVAQRLDAYSGRQSLPSAADLEAAPKSAALPMASMMAAFFIGVPMACAIMGGIAAAAAEQTFAVIFGSMAAFGAIGWFSILLFSRRERRRRTSNVKEWVEWYSSLPRALKTEAEMVVAKPKAQ